MTTRFIEQSLLGMISMKFRSLWHRRPIREASPTVRNVDRRPYSKARLACTDGVYVFTRRPYCPERLKKALFYHPRPRSEKLGSARLDRQNKTTLVSRDKMAAVWQRPIAKWHWKTVVWSINVQLIYCQICYSLFNYICCICYFAFCAGTYRGPDVTCRWEELRIGQRSHFLGNRFTL